MQSVPDRVGVAIHRLVVLTLVAVGMLVSATPVLAADPTAYLASMPTAEEVTTRFVGSDSFDTAARQYAAFERLDALMGKLIGDRLVTAPERAVRDVYYNNPAGSAWPRRSRPVCPPTSGSATPARDSRLGER